ncbi:MAG: aminodeoxychorismate synthase component I, partial [Sphingomonadaceae bacterium]|nr:aminodeoxychorismate synthase component I [Sphingomonadaceae bacterium]
MTPRLDDKHPFVLLDDARGGKGVARLYRKPVEIIEAWEPEQVADALAAIEAAVASGRHAAGYIAYEAGFALEAKLAPLAREGSAAPLVWFGLFERFHRTDARSIPAKLPDPAGAWLGAPRPLIDEAVYRLRIGNIQAYIEAGDIYQANFTFRATVATQGDPLALYARMRASSRAGYGGVVFTGERWLLSLSPEMFFASIGGRLTARPMKGTAARLDDPAEDAAAARGLAEDPKQRAENLMIVDLLRNDLSRVAEPGSVAVPSLFRVETFPTIHQMTSTVTARLAGGRSATDVLRAIFPCGSITGAPKLRAMEVIDELEERPRGPYTGSIGWLEPGGDAAFNVAIRTLAMTAGEDGAVLGLGSGIVADSEAGEEWRECLAKGAFVTAGARRFDLFETMRFDTDEGLVDLERHLARMGASAAALEFAFDRHAARNELQAATFGRKGRAMVRLLLSPTGTMA